MAMTIVEAARSRPGGADSLPGLITGGVALSHLSLMLIPVSVLTCWLGMDGMLAGVFGRRTRGLVRLEWGYPSS